MDPTPTTGSQGRYHGAGFADAARELGLVVSKGSSHTGWGTTSMKLGTRQRFRKVLRILELEI
jgi:hypothetical protein